MNETARPLLLVVDDEKPIRQLLARIAVRAGFDADVAKDGIEALEMMAKKDYMIVIVDLMMPRLSGYELVQKISAITPRPTIIVATAMTNGEIATLDDSLVRRVIRKPFDIKAVAAALVETARQIVEAREQGQPASDVSDTPYGRVIHGDVLGALAPEEDEPKEPKA